MGRVRGLERETEPIVVAAARADQRRGWMRSSPLPGLARTPVGVPELGHHF
jgi:hypothetical protein